MVDSHLRKRGGNIEVFPEPTRKKIVECRRCVVGMIYRPQLRERNLGLQGEYAPKGEIRTVILGESPPFKGGYIYNPQTRCSPRTFSYQVFSDLGYVTGANDVLSESRKEELLRRMGNQDSALVLDCCHCAVNQLREGSQDEERDRLVATCFAEHTEKALARIREEYDPEIWFKFPPHRGDELWKVLKAKYGLRIVRKEYWATPRRVV